VIRANGFREDLHVRLIVLVDTDDAIDGRAVARAVAAAEQVSA
jgi:hypothetical protein